MRPYSLEMRSYANIENSYDSSAFVHICFKIFVQLLCFSYYLFPIYILCALTSLSSTKEIYSIIGWKKSVRSF
jgi:hypothetical protein